MNIVNIRSTLRPMCDALWPRRRVADAPFFLWEQLDNSIEAMRAYDKDGIRDLIYTAQTRDELRKMSPEGPTAAALASIPTRPDSPTLRLPFPEFIIHIPADPNHPQHPMRAEVIVVVNSPTALHPDLLIYYPDDEDIIASATLAHQLKGNPKTTYRSAFFNLKTGEEIEDERVLFRLYEHQYDYIRRCIPSHPGFPIPEFESMEWIPLWRVSMGQRLKPFLFQVFFPSNHVVSSRPAGLNKPVEWVKARTHYQIMGRRSMAHIAKEGHPLSAQEHAEQKKRAAHDRIAHTRLLRSPRFGVNVGRRIHVRSTWVGPTEWIGTDGKIYKVLPRKPGSSEPSPGDKGSN